MKTFDVISPKLISDKQGISAWFTLKNGHHQQPSQHIAGLNVGFNTEEEYAIVKQNRAQLCRQLNLEPTSIAYAHQVHGSHIQAVEKGGTYDNTDALITQIPGITLAIQVADCAGVLLWEPSSRTVAAVHAGWRGAVAAILPKTIEKMVGLGASSANMNAFISPCISQPNFEVGEEVAREFPTAVVDRSSYTKPHVDLKKILEMQLIEGGLESKKIEVHPGCTVDGSDRFYSYRREGSASGRMVTLIRLNPMRL